MIPAFSRLHAPVTRPASAWPLAILPKPLFPAHGGRTRIHRMRVAGDTLESSCCRTYRCRLVKRRPWWLSIARHDMYPWFCSLSMASRVAGRRTLAYPVPSPGPAVPCTHAARPGGRGGPAAALSPGCRPCGECGECPRAWSTSRSALNQHPVHDQVPGDTLSAWPSNAAGGAL